MHKMNALAVGRQLYGVPDNIKDHLLKYREEQIQSLISVLKDEGRSLV
jgi:N-acetyl-anhydromuramyl-L-alanine amidase AmpD